MKFGKRLQSHLDETIPEWRDKFLSYKHLKKRLKLITAPLHQVEQGISRRSAAASPSSSGHSGDDCTLTDDDPAVDMVNPCATVSSCGSGVTDERNAHMVKDPTAEELDFVGLLNAEMDKFNAFFIEKEEEYVIRLQELKERIASLRDRGDALEPTSETLNQKLINIKKDLVNFYGEMVLLENYSSLNYTGLVKILKKHDKLTGALIRVPYIQNVLQQPFFTTDLLSKLVRDCESNLLSLFPMSSISLRQCRTCLSQSTGSNYHAMPRNMKDSYAAADGQSQCLQGDEDVGRIYKSTMAALRTIRDLRRGSSTYSIFSLPPFDRTEDEIYACPLDSSMCSAPVQVSTAH